MYCVLYFKGYRFLYLYLNAILELKDVEFFENKFINDYINNLKFNLIYETFLNFFIFYKIQNRKDDE